MLSGRQTLTRRKHMMRWYPYHIVANYSNGKQVYVTRLVSMFEVCRSTISLGTNSVTKNTAVVFTTPSGIQEEQPKQVQSGF